MMINLKQINGGVKLRQDVDTLQQRYDAYKVLTTLSKGTKTSVTMTEDGTSGIFNTPDKFMPYPVPVFKADGVVVTGEVLVDENGTTITLTDYSGSEVTVEGVVNVEGVDVYTADEVLLSLRVAMDALQGEGGEGLSIDERIQAAKDDLQGKIDTINNKIVKDVVRVASTLGTNGDGTGFALGAGFTEVVEDASDLTKPYAIFKKVDGSLVPTQDQDGNQLYVDLRNPLAPVLLKADKETPGVYSVIDPTDADPTDGVTYIADATEGGIEAFVYIEGSYKFQDLSDDHLLDNIEYSTIAYTKAIDKIIVDLAQDQDLIDTIAALVGTQTVQNQIAAITDGLNTRLGAAESAITTLNGNSETEGSVAKAVADAKAEVDGRLDVLEGDSETEGSVAKAVADAKAEVDGRLDVLEGDSETEGSVAKAVADAQTTLQGNIDTLEDTVIANRVESVNKDIDLQYGLDLINAESVEVELFTAIEGQTVFTVSKTPVASKVVDLYVNGIKYNKTTHFTVNGSTVTWTWTESNSGFDMEAGFVVEVRYTSAIEVVKAEYIA